MTHMQRTSERFAAWWAGALSGVLAAAAGISIATGLSALFIAFYTNQSLNWGMAAALSVLLMLPLAMMLYAGRYLTRAVPA